MTYLILKKQSVCLSIVMKRRVGGKHVVKSLLKDLLLLLKVELLDSVGDTMSGLLTHDTIDTTADHVLQ